MKLTQCIKIQIARPADVGWDVVLPTLWELQRQTAKILNFCIREYYLHDCRCEEWKAEHGRYPTKEEMPERHLYAELRVLFPDVPPRMQSQLERQAKTGWRTDRKDVLYFQRKSLPSFRQSHPLVFHNQMCAVKEEAGNYFLTAQIRPRDHEGITRCRFLLNTKKLNSGQKSILDRLVSGEYGMGAPRVSQRDKKWFAVIPYHFSAPAAEESRREVRMGVDLGVAVPAVCAIHGSLERLFLKEEGATIHSFFNQVYRRRRNILGNGKDVLGRSSGHGRKNKLKAIEKFRDKVTNFRNTSNHRISFAAVEWARKNGVTVIVLEDLSGIHEKSTFLKRWPYFDLQTKIQYKAKRYGIAVETVEPRKTSQRCSACGHISHENRQEQAAFCCQSCGFEANADYNAALNLATPGIEKLIERALA